MMMTSITMPTKMTMVPGDKPHTNIITLEPFFPGYGVTVGNALRRVLLSSIPGAAVTAVKIDGVEHEFSTVEGIKEDVVQVLLNLKKLRFKSFSDEPVSVTLKWTGAGIITGKDLTVPSSVELINPDQKIAEATSKDAKLALELWVEKGFGYVPIEQRPDEKAEIGRIALDAIFTPVQKVNFEVESSRVGQMTNYEKVVYTIQTDGSISPEEAIRHATQLLIDHLKALQAPFLNPADIEAMEKPALPEMPGAETATDVTPVAGDLAEMGFSARTMKALSAAGIATMADLSSKTEADLKAVDGLGDKALADIMQALSDRGMSLAQ